MSSIFSNFFRLFSEVFLFDRFLVRTLGCFTGQLVYSIIEAISVSSVFSDFFRFFSEVFPTFDLVFA